jgi:uncharacterized membrane protein YfcA
MLEKIKNLIDLKSIITILLVVTLIGVIFGNVNISDEAIKTLFVSITSSVFTYYFTRKTDKNNLEGE